MVYQGDLLFEKDIKENPVGDFLLDSSGRQPILMRLSTPYGSNLFHPEYGNKIFDILSDSINDDWINMAVAYERECVEQDPNIKVEDIESSVSMEERKVYFRITYRDLETEETNELTWGENIG